MPLIAAAIGAPIAGGIIGNMMGAGDRQKELELQQQALAGIQGVELPDSEKMKIALQQYQNAGQLSPQLESIVNAGPTELAGVQTDPRLASAQMQALASLQKYGAGGLQPEDLAALNKVKQATAQQERGRQQAILQSMQERGVGGSGAELAARLNSSQAAANRSSDQDMDIAGQSSQRALQAIMNSGQLGGQMRSQEFGEQAQKATAQDVINRYNAMNSQAVQGKNVGAMNAAQQSNLANKQAVMNANVGLTNQQEVQNRALAQQQYQNALNKASAAAGQQHNLAGTYGKNAAATQQMVAGIGQGIGQGATAGAAYAGRKQAPQTKNPLEEDEE